MSRYSITCESHRDCVFNTYFEAVPSTLRQIVTDASSQHVVNVAKHHLDTAIQVTADGKPYGGHPLYAVRDGEGREVADLEFHGKLPNPRIIFSLSVRQ